MARLTEEGGKKVIFRRIRGRLVPIKIDARSAGAFKAARTKRANVRRTKSDVGKGFGLLGIGVGLTFGADALAVLILGRGTKNLASQVVAARDIVRTTTVGAALGKTSIPGIKRAARLTFGISGFTTKLKSLTLGTSLLKAAGVLIGTGITSAGVSDLRDAVGGRNLGASGEVISHVIGTGITVLGARVLKKTFKVGLGKKTGLKVKDGQLAFKFETGQQPGI